MQYRYLGSTGVEVSRLCMGTMTFGKEADEEASAALYARCREAGINFFDCADVYVGGESERILGELIHGHRNEVVITSKVFGAVGPDRNSRGTNRRHILRAVEDSLRRLKTDRIDIYYLHRWDAHTPTEEALRALDDLVSQGKIVYPGVSNYAAWQIARSLGISAREGLAAFKVIQPMYNLVKRQAEVEILPLAQAENLGVVTYSPLGGGLLTGKYQAGAGSDTASGRIRENEMYAKRYSRESDVGAARDFAALARARGIHPATLAVAWVAAHPAVTAPIIGARSLEQLEPSLGALDVAMTDELYAEISRLVPTPPPATDRWEEVKE